MDYDVRGTGDWGWSATLLVSHSADPPIQLPIQFKHFQYLILIKLTNFALVKKVLKNIIEYSLCGPVDLP